MLRSFDIGSADRRQLDECAGRDYILWWEDDMKYTVRLEKNHEGYAVWCPGLPGCWSQGDTEDEALANIKDAIETYLETVGDLLGDKDTRIVEVGP